MERQIINSTVKLGLSKKKSIFELRKKVLPYFVNKALPNDAIDDAISLAMEEQHERIKGYSK